MTFCEKCGKEIVKGTVCCPIPVKKLDPVWVNVNPIVIILFGAYAIYSIFDAPLMIIGCAIGYFWTGKWCVEMALKNNRSPNWAFFAGGFFNLIGYVIYWIYIKCVGEKKD